MTYFRGIDHPDHEPRRNQYTEAKRRSKFTEEVAATVVDGDLYFSMRTPAHQRFFVEFQEGEHGLTESGLLCVTHRFNKRFPDLPGKWEPYDSGGNLVITVRKTGEESLAFEAEQAIEQALYRTRLGRVVGRDALRDMANSLCSTFGVDRDRDEHSTFTLDPDAEKLAKDALRDLLLYAPENGYPEELGSLGAEYDGIGFASDGVAYASLLNGESDGDGGEGTGKPLPLMSQPVFYAVLGGKHEGRGFQSRIDALMKAVGLDEEDL